ncbi:polymer-forming cytoskeletal protein [Salmonella enterica]|nr:polymer-forming cytoskeletal protein [Salmonella enterica]
MRKNHGRNSSRCIYLLYLVYVVWLCGLGLFCLQRPEAGLFFFLTLVFLGLFICSEIRSYMFSKKLKTQQEDADTGLSNHATLPTAVNSSTTVIGEGTIIEGNILQGRNAEVYGRLTGDITLPEGTVRVMPGGTVSGTVRATGIVIGGEVEGCCEAKDVTVLEKGILRGTCRSVAFSIKPGGVFTGTSETLTAGLCEFFPGLHDADENGSKAVVSLPFTEHP